MNKINRAFAEPLDRSLLEEEIRELTLAIKATLDPKRFILFGSAIKGPFYKDSDFDLLVVFENEKKAQASWRQFSKIRRCAKRSIDMISMSEKEFQLKKSQGGIAMVAFVEGRVLL